MKLNVHSLAIKQTLLILLGMTLVFGTLLFTLQRLINTRMSELIMARGHEISERNVSLIDNIFEGSASIVKNVVETLERGEITQKDIEEFLPQAYQKAHEKVSIASALVIAYEPENGKEFIRITGDGLQGKVIGGTNYQSMSWYADAKSKGKGFGANRLSVITSTSLSRSMRSLFTRRSPMAPRNSRALSVSIFSSPFCVMRCLRFKLKIPDMRLSFRQRTKLSRTRVMTGFSRKHFIRYRKART